MARVSKAIAHLSPEEVQQKIQTAANFRQQQKWLVVYNALVDPRAAAEIALHTGTSVRTVIKSSPITTDWVPPQLKLKARVAETIVTSAWKRKKSFSLALQNLRQLV